MDGNVIFQCATQKCNNGIAVKDLNPIELEVLRSWPKNCPRCKKTTKWLEQTSLLDTKTTIYKQKNGVQHALPDH